MKKTLIALAALAATGAFAQSSVSLTGGINAGLSRAAGATAISTNQAAASNLTFTAVEDLGSGLKATAFVNVRFNPATGQNAGTGALAGADNFAQNVGFALAGGFGEVKAGRFNGPVQGPLGKYEPFGTDTNGVATSGTLVPVRNNSEVMYTTPSFAGLKGAIQWTDKNGNPGSKKSGVELAGYYDNGPLSVMVGSTQKLDDTTTNSVYAYYDLGVVKPMFLYAKNKDIDRKETGLGLTAPVGAFLIKAAYGVTTIAGVDTKRTALGTTYTLSKRTSLIADMNKDTAVKTAYYLGVRHTF